MKYNIITCLLFLLTACGGSGAADLQGYVEGRFLRIAPTSGAILQRLDVGRGDKVDAGQALFALDDTYVISERDRAAATVRRARANLQDLIKGARREKLDILFRKKDQAEAALVKADRDYQRARQLGADGFDTQAHIDAVSAAYEAARGRVAEISAQIADADMGARADAILAARAAVEEAQQTLRQAEKRVSEIAPVAPKKGIIQATYYRPGEYVPAGRPVVSLFMPEKTKVRFFVPQKLLPHLRIGQKVMIRCDGCSKPIPAQISFIAAKSEYTPPVIYSISSRDKLVFMVEARPVAPAPLLHPGLPVDIALP